MKKGYFIIATGLLIPFLFTAFTPPKKSTVTPEYIVIGWNDLGMHCSNKDFTNMAILPPYNNQHAHVIMKGSPTSMPQVMSQGSNYKVTYEIPGNTYSGSTTNTSKTNFWQYSLHLFNVLLPPDTGLTGFGLTGTMMDTLNYFYVDGIPVTPFQDADLVNEDPFQLILLKAYDPSMNLLASTQTVIPVSNEINCVSSGCHSSEMNILNEHEDVPGFDIANKPILCANCHSDNALGMPGMSGVEPFSQVIHQEHAEKTNDCYKCHPGPNTQCFRDVMHTAGMTCQDCHGSVADVGNSIENGREPWLEEPSCGAASCHGANFAEEPGKLFRQSKGHGGLFCSTCHGSPHAILPSEEPRDNIQNIALQGYAGILDKCEVCHGYTPNAPGPHGFNPVGIIPVSDLAPDKDQLLQNYPNPAVYMTKVPYQVKNQGHVTIKLYDMSGNLRRTMINLELKPGQYVTELYTSGLSSGTYVCVLETEQSKDQIKILIVN